MGWGCGGRPNPPAPDDSASDLRGKAPTYGQDFDRQRPILEGKWFKVEGASSEAIARLKAVSPVSLPESYFALLDFSNGGEGPLCVQPLWLSLFPAEEVVRLVQAGTFAESFPTLLVIGSNGAGEAVAFDLRTPDPYTVVAFDMGNTDVAESVQPMAASFDEMLGLIGYDEELT